MCVFMCVRPDVSIDNSLLRPGRRLASLKRGLEQTENKDGRIEGGREAGREEQRVCAGATFTKE